MSHQENIKGSVLRKRRKRLAQVYAKRRVI
jgi:hypothetical protein